jgi:chromosomal replication initiation ATPase DnaA
MTPYSYPGLNVESNESILNQAIWKVLSIPHFSHLTPEEVLSKSRHTPISQAKHVLRCFLFNRTKSKSITASILGCDHSTVINSLKRVEDMEVGNPQLYKQIISKL